MWGLPANFGADPPGTYVKSIQRSSITLASVTSNTATINAVNTATSVVLWNGTNCNSVPEDQAECRMTLTNSTTITATRSSSTSTVTIFFTVIEFTSSAVESVQYGTVSATAATSATATISSVDTSRSAVFYLGRSTTSSDSLYWQYQTGVTLTNSTTVTAITGTAKTWIASFVVVQFQARVIKSIQQIANAFTTTNATDTQAISSVVANNCMIAWGNVSGSTNANPDNVCYVPTVTSSTNVNLVRGGTLNASRTPYYTVIEFQPYVLNGAISNGTIVLNNVTSNTATISSVNVNKTVVNYVSQTTGGGTGGPRPNAMSASLQNSTHVIATVNQAVAANHTAGYQLIKFW